MDLKTDSDTMDALTKATPPVAVSGLSLAGVSLSEWVLLATLAYTVLQAYFLIRDKAYRPWKEKQAAAGN